MKFRHSAFISYNRAQDARLAQELRRSLHGFAKPLFSRPTMHVFLDDKVLTPGEPLSPRIGSELAQSEFLILLACPASARSEWVRQEVEQWLDAHCHAEEPPRKLLLVLTGGDIAWDAEKGDFDWERTTALPTCLRARFSEMPLALDWRRLRESGRVSRRSDEFRSGVAGLAAALRGTTKEQVWNDDARQLRRTNLLMGTALLVMSVLLCLTVLFWNTATRNERQAAKNADEATKNAVRAQENLVSQSVAMGLEYQRRDELPEALACFTDALRKDQSHPQAQTREPLHRLRLAMLSREFPELRGTWVDTAEIRGATLSRDGQRVLTWTLESARVRETLTGKPLGLPVRFGSVQQQVAFSPDGDRLAVFEMEGVPAMLGRGTGKIVVFDVATAAPVVPAMKADGTCHHLAFSPDGKTLAADIVQGKSSVLQAWDASSGESKWTSEPCAGLTSCMCFSADGKQLATAHIMAVARTWDCETGRSAAPPLRHQGPVHHVAFSHSGKYLVTSCNDRAARVWDWRTGETPIVTLWHGGVVKAAEFDPSDTLIVSRSLVRENDFSDAPRGETRCWNARTGEPMSTPFPFGAEVTSSSLTGSQVVVGSADKTARLYRFDGRKFVAATPALPATAEVKLVAHLPESQAIVVADAAGLFRIYADEVKSATIRPAVADGRDGRCLAVHPSGRQLCVLDESNPKVVWIVSDASDGPREIRLEHSFDVAQAAFSPDGKRLATATGLQIGNSLALQELASKLVQVDPESVAKPAFEIPVPRSTAQLWDVASGQRVGDSLEHPGEITNLLFGDKGRLLLTAGGGSESILSGEVRIWRTESGTSFCPPLKQSVNIQNLALSSDGRRLATLSLQGLAQVWDLTAGSGIARSREVGYGFGAGIAAIALSPDGRHLATGDQDGKIRIWNAVTGESVAPPIYQPGGVLQLTFNPSGNRLLSVTKDIGARLWDVATAAPVTQEMPHPRVAAAVFRPDGVLLATAGDDKKVRLWDAATGNLLGQPLDHPLIVLQFGIAQSPLTFSDRELISQGFSDASFWDLSSDSATVEEAAEKAEWQALRQVDQKTSGIHVPSMTSDRSWLESLCERFTDNASLWARSARLASEAGDHTATVQRITQAIEKGGRRVEWLTLRSEANANLKRWKDAAGDYELLDKDGVRSPENDLKQAECWAKTHSYNKALAALNGVLEGKLPLRDQSIRLRAVMLKANYLAELEEWNRAKEELARLADSADLGFLRLDARFRYLEGVTHLALGDEAGFGDVARKMAKEFAGRSDPDSQYFTSWTAAIAPTSSDNWQAALGAAQLAVQAQPDNAAYLATLGAVQFRAGRFVEALATLERASALRKKSKEGIVAYDDLFRALTLRRLGRPEAAAALNEVKRWIDQHQPHTVAEGVEPLTWYQRVVTRHLMKEADAGRLDAKAASTFRTPKRGQAG